VLFYFHAVKLYIQIRITKHFVLLTVNCYYTCTYLFCHVRLFVDSSLGHVQFILPNLTIEAEDHLEGKWPDGTGRFYPSHGRGVAIQLLGYSSRISQVWIGLVG
jgi:hypothetical protein